MATCPTCGQKTYYYRGYRCKVCGIEGHNYKCYNSACGIQENTTNHDNASCPTCSGRGTITQACNSNDCEYVSQTRHKYVCSVCGVTQSTSSHTWTRGRCYECGATCSHTGGNHANGGVCTICDYGYQSHGQSGTLQYKNITSTTHTPYYACTYQGCATTYDSTAQSHNVTTWTDNGDGTHSGTCTQCGYTVTSSHTYGTDNNCTTCGAKKPCTHTGGTHANNGTCTNCGEQYQTHAQSTTISKYEKTTNGHQALYKCTETTCTYTYSGTEEAHTGGTHANGGVCEKCSSQYENHGRSTTVLRYEQTTNGHNAIYKCTETACTVTYTGSEETHSGGTHANGGLCEKCEKQYQTHEQSTTIDHYEQTTNGHKAIYKCTETTCTYTYTGTEEAHTGGTHANGGVCEKCGTQYENHGKSETIIRYEETANGHIPVYKCTDDTCTETYTGDEEAHTGGTHENGGTCEKCGKQYQNHEQSTTIDHYEQTTNGHKTIYKCTEVTCTVTYIGPEEAHTGGTHANEGICEKCGAKYENHGKSETIIRYEETANGHIPIYKCTDDTCTETYTGDEEAHTGGTHENGGKCEKCGKEYQNHEQSTTIDHYEQTTNGHKTIYKCTEVTCTVTYVGPEEAHTGGTHANGGVCEKCGAKYEEHGKSETVIDYEKTANGHIPIYKCKWPNCNERIRGDEEQHTVTSWVDNGDGTHSGKCDKCQENVTENHEYENGKCKDCDADEPVTECTHTWEYQNDETYHWQKCTKCNETRNKEKHTMTAAKDNGNGTHTKTCTKCNYKITTSHKYGNDGECEDCHAQKPTTECDHDWKEKSDDTNHWEECTKCGEIKNQEKHKVEDWKDNGDGTHSGTCVKCNKKVTKKHEAGSDGRCKDCNALINKNNSSNNNSGNTSAGKDIPNTGVNTVVIIGIVSFTALGGTSLMLLRKYHEI